MTSILTLVLLVFFNYLMINGQTSGKILLIDETQEFINKAASQDNNENRRAIAETIGKDAAGFWQVSADCVAQSKILSIGEGRFVSRDRKQIAFLYSLCAGLQGLILLDQGKVFAHFGFRNEADVGILKLEDINQNGFDEILIRSEQIDRRGYFRKHRILEFSPSGISEIFYYQTYKQELNVPTRMLKSAASKIYVEKAAKPQFYEEQFSNDKASWDNNGQNIRYDSGWKQVTQMTKLENLPAAKIVEYFEIPKSIISK